MPVQAVADLLDVGDDRIWWVVTHYVEAARAEEDFSAVTAVGIDETAARRGHDYITVSDFAGGCAVDVAGNGRASAALARAS